MIFKLSQIPEHPQFEKIIATLDERLPTHLKTPVLLQCQFSKTKLQNIPILILQISGPLTILCQRCTKFFDHHYESETKLALCSTDDMAARLMETMEVVVADVNNINIIDIITDEIYLYAPEKHENCLQV